MLDSAFPMQRIQGPHEDPHEYGTAEYASLPAFERNLSAEAQPTDAEAMQAKIANRTNCR